MRRGSSRSAASGRVTVRLRGPAGSTGAPWRRAPPARSRRCRRRGRAQADSRAASSRGRCRRCIACGRRRARDPWAPRAPRDRAPRAGRGRKAQRRRGAAAADAIVHQERHREAACGAVEQRPEVRFLLGRRDSAAGRRLPRCSAVPATGAGAASSHAPCRTPPKSPAPDRRSGTGAAPASASTASGTVSASSSAAATSSTWARSQAAAGVRQQRALIFATSAACSVQLPGQP